jgi:hypothetical protein
MEILQDIAANAYLTAFSLFEILQSSPQSLSQSDLQALAAKTLHRLERDLEERQKKQYEKFFSDPSIPDGERALVAEEYAHVLEEMKTALIPPWVTEPQIQSTPRNKPAKTTKKKRK